MMLRRILFCSYTLFPRLNDAHGLVSLYPRSWPSVGYSARIFHTAVSFKSEYMVDTTLKNETNFFLFGGQTLQHQLRLVIRCIVWCGVSV